MQLVKEMTIVENMNKKELTAYAVKELGMFNWKEARSIAKDELIDRITSRLQSINAEAALDLEIIDKEIESNTPQVDFEDTDNTVSIEEVNQAVAQKYAAEKATKEEAPELTAEEKAEQRRIAREQKKQDRMDELLSNPRVQEISNETAGLQSKIKRLHELGIKNSEIAMVLGCHTSTVYEVVNGKYDKRTFNVTYYLNNRKYVLMGYYKDNKDRTEEIEEAWAKALTQLNDVESFAQARQTDINKQIRSFLPWNVAGLKTLVK